MPSEVEAALDFSYRQRNQLIPANIERQRSTSNAERLNFQKAAGGGARTHALSEAERVLRSLDFESVKKVP